MKKRRATSEVVAAMLMFTVIATASFLAVSISSKQTLENEKTITEALHEKNTQIQELVSVISQKTQPNKIVLEMINYGLKEITIQKVLVDGNESEFVIKNDHGALFTNNTIPKKTILVLEANMVGKSIQLITTTGNLINIKI
ncbi:MAG: hypothetical protein ACT4NT_03035 [Nitrososphaerota archaeon]